MLKIISTIFLLIFMLSCTEKKTEKNISLVDKTDNQNHKNTHSIPTNVYTSKNRDLWQKPDIILDYLGNLKDKTIADIGAGPSGYFTFIIANTTNVKKVISVDIDTSALNTIARYKQILPQNVASKIETKLVSPKNPELAPESIDIAFISNTLPYISNKKDYLTYLYKSLKKGGFLFVVDYKMKELPQIFPPSSERISLSEMEKLIDKTAFTRFKSIDMELNYQYIVMARK